MKGKVHLEGYVSNSVTPTYYGRVVTRAEFGFKTLRRFFIIYHYNHYVVLLNVYIRVLTVYTRASIITNRQDAIFFFFFFFPLANPKSRAKR